LNGHHLGPGGLALLLCVLATAPARGEPAPPPAAAPAAPAAAREGDPEFQLDEIVVRVQRPEPAGPGAAATVVDATRFAGESKSVAELLSTAPGVAVHDHGGLGQLATVSIRGASADDVKVLIDGIPLNTASGGGVNLSTIPRQWISRIEVVRGAEGARYGAGALGGAVNIVTVRPREELWNTQLSYGSFNTLSAGAEGATGGERWGALLSLGYDQTDGDFPYLFDPQPTVDGNALEERVRHNNAGRSGGVLAKGFWDAAGGRLDLLAQLSAGTRDLPGEAANPTPDDHQEDLRAVTVVRHALPLGGPFRLSTEASLRHDRLDVRLNEPLDVNARQRGLAAAGQLATAWSTGAHAGEVGARLGGERLDASGLGARRERAELAVFGSEELALAGGRLRLGPALRWERVGPFDGWSAKLGGSMAITGPWRVRASAGRTFRAPSFAELYLQQGLIEPNPDLRSEESVSGDAGVEVAGALGLARLGAFATLYRDLIVYEPVSFGRLKPFNSGKAAARGLEVELASQPFTRLGLAGALSYTLLATEILRGQEGVLGNELPRRAPHRLFARASGGRGPLAAHAELHFVAAQWKDSRNFTRIPEALTVHAGGSWRLVRRPDLRLHVEVRNLLDDRELQDGFGNPLPSRMVLVALRAGSPTQGAP
jgi:vitamin B12 transporter